MLNEFKNVYALLRAKFSQGHSCPLAQQPQSSPPPNYSTRILIPQDSDLREQPAYPRIGDARLGVLEGRQESHGQVVSHVQQFVVIVLDGHVTKGLLGVRDYSMGRKQAPEDPDDRKDTNTKPHWLETHTTQFR